MTNNMKEIIIIAVGLLLVNFWFKETELFKLLVYNP